jgi:NADPH-dependent curcumin reductase CurA
LAGQIARIKGCRVVGTAGTDKKCEWLKEELGFASAINYRQCKNLTAAVTEACPQGVNVFFDNVGGEILDAALANLALRGRIVLCGAISQYNKATAQGPRNYMELISRRGRMEGFILFDYAARYPEAIQQLGQWVGEGRLKSKLDIVEGLERAPLALRRLFEGDHQGKLLVRIAPQED